MANPLVKNPGVLVENPVTGIPDGDPVLQQQALRESGQEQTADEILKQRQEAMRRQVEEQFRPHKGQHELLEKYRSQGSAVDQFVYGGVMPTELEELDLVKAWRPNAVGEWYIDVGVVHRLHRQDGTVTVQFVPDQNRIRLPYSSVEKIQNLTPTYPKIRLAPGEKLPTPAEIRRREERAEEERRLLRLAPNQPLPGQEMEGLREGETVSENKDITLQANFWGLPESTLDALRNRSLPGTMIQPTYGPHFYTKLYENRFYPQKPVMRDETHHVGLAGGGAFVEQLQQLQEAATAAGDGAVLQSMLQTQTGARLPGAGRRILSHTYIPLEGPQLSMDMKTGQWFPIPT